MKIDRTGLVIKQYPIAHLRNWSPFLADRTNGRAYATVLRLSVCL